MAGPIVNQLEPHELGLCVCFLRIEGSSYWWLGPSKPQQWKKINGNFIHIKGNQGRTVEKNFKGFRFDVCALFFFQKKKNEKRKGEFLGPDLLRFTGWGADATVFALSL